MKRKQGVCAVAALLAAGQIFAGCGMAKDVSKAVLQNKQVEKTAKDDTKEDKTKGSETETIAVESNNGDKPVIGEEGIEGYEGFSYLYEELLMTESEENPETGKMESHKLTIYIPKSEYNSVDRGRAYSDKLGVDFEAELNPYLQYEQEDYLPEENLQNLLSEQYDEFYTTDYEDLNISEISQGIDGSSNATVSYCRYNEWDDVYEVVYTYYNLKELDNGISFLTKISINATEATGKTPELLKELGDFYQMKIDWSKEAAEKRLADYEASNTGDTKKISTGYLIFDLPKSWSEDDSYSTYDNMVYAPGGDLDAAGCALGFIEEYVGEEAEDISTLLQDETVAPELIESFVSEIGDNYTMEYIGETCIGDTTAITFEEGTGADATTMTCYIGGKNENLYVIQAITSPSATEDVFALAKDVLENGKVR